MANKVDEINYDDEQSGQLDIIPEYDLLIDVDVILVNIFALCLIIQ